MQHDQTVKLIWPDEETRDRVRALAASNEVMRLALDKAVEGAAMNSVPRIMAGAHGFEPFRIMLACEQFVTEGARVGFGDEAGSDEAFVWREGYLAVCRYAADEFGQHVAAIGVAGAALMQLATGLNATVEALTALERLQAAAAPASKPVPVPHALALGCRPAAPVRNPPRRPLRPEDFGALSR